MQPHPHLVGADRLDRVPDLDPAPVQLRAASGTNRRRDIGGPDRAKQPSAAARPRLQAYGKRLEPPCRLLGVVDAADLTGGARSPDQVDLLLGTARPAHGESTRDQIITPIARSDVDDVAGRTQAADLLGEDELHRRATHRYPTSLALACRARVWQERHLTGILDRCRDVPLMLGAVAGDSP